MKLKRIMALILCFAMVFSTMSFTVFANESDAVATVNGKEFTDIQEAIVAAAPSGTVELLADVTVEEWVMITQTLTIGTDELITVDKIDGLTIDGNNKTLTIESIESAENGGYLFYDADKLNVMDLTINCAEGLVGGICLASGTISNVTFNGGTGVFPGTGNITITGCTFNTNCSAIYNEDARDNLVVTGNTFNTVPGQYAIYLRGNTTFTNNTVVNGKVNVVSGSPVVTGNDFGNERFKVYNVATASIENNTINNLVFNDETLTQSVFSKNTLSEAAQSALDAATAPAELIAKIGAAEYETLEVAFAAAVEGDTITLLSDAAPALTSQRAITKASTIDLGGNTLTLKEDDLYFGTTTFKNGTIIVDPSVKPSTAVFWMFADQTLTLDNVKVVASGVTGTYLIGLDGNNSDLNIINGSEILIENNTALDLDVICVNASTGNDILIDNSKINVKNLDGRVLFRGNYTISGNSELYMEGITKAGIRIEAGQTLAITDTASVTIIGEPRDGGIHLTDPAATYTKADTATVNATINAQGEFIVPATGSNSFAYTGEVDGKVRVWGEGGGNARKRFVLKLYSDETLMATTQLNNVGGIINGNVYVTWNFFYPESNDEYWTTTWEAGHPNADAQPTKVELYIDGTLVATTDAKMSGADGINPVIWSELGGVKKTGLSGTGTEEDPFQITSLEDLKFFCDSVNAGESYKGKTVKMTANIDLAGEEWTPIGCPMEEKWVGFQGTFDGNGHTLSNLKINRPEAWGQGLFGYIKTNATIKNITVNNAEVTGEDTSGVIAGYAYMGTFTNCHVTGDVKVTGNEHVGGIVGNGYYANFSDCSVVANEGSFVNATLRSFAAGIVGYHGEGNLKIENCTVKNLDITAYGAVGAITGIAQYGNTITGCTVENVSLTKTRADGHASIGLACGTWTAKANGADYTTTITNNSFKDVSINGTAISPLNQLYGSNYSGSSEQIKLVESGITYENIDTTNFKVMAVKIGEKYFVNLDEALDWAKNEGMTEVEITVIDDIDFSTKVKNFAKVTFTGTDRKQTVDMNINSSFEDNVALEFNNLTVSRLDKEWLYHYTHVMGGLNFNNCKMIGLFNITAQDTNFIGCDFYNDDTFGDGNYSIWLSNCFEGVEVNITDCTFDVYERAIKTYGDNYNGKMVLNISGTEFVSRTADKTVVEMAYDYGTGVGSVELNIVNSTAIGFGAPEHIAGNLNAWFNVEGNNSNSIVTIDDVKVWPVATAVAQIGNTEYETIEAAINAAVDGDEIIVLAETTVNEETVITKNITISGEAVAANGMLTVGNGASLVSSNLTGNYYAAADASVTVNTPKATLNLAGNVTFEGTNIVSGFSAGWYNNVVTINEDDSLEVTGSRVTVSYGNKFNIKGNIQNAKETSKESLTPSLKLVGGISLNGNGSGVELNVENAYVVLGDTTSKNTGATGTFNINFTNSIVDLTKTIKTYLPTAEGLSPVFNFNIKDSVVTSSSHIEFWSSATNVTLDNSDLTVGGSFANAGALNIVNGSEFVVKAPIMSSHGGNTGTIFVDGAVMTLCDSNQDWENAGTIKLTDDATLNIWDFKCVDNGKIIIDAKDMPAGTTSKVIEGGQSGKTLKDKVTVENGSDVTVTYGEDGDVTVEKAQAAVVVAKIGDAEYATLQEAVNNANGKTVTVLTDIDLGGTTVTIPDGVDMILDLNGKTISGVSNVNQQSMFFVDNKAKLTVKDSAGNGKITYGVGTSNIGFEIDVKGGFVLESGTIELTGSWNLGFAVDVRPNAWGTAYTEPTKFVMNGGKIVSSDTAVRVASNSSDKHEPLGVSFIMNDGIIESDWDAVFIQHLYANDLSVEIKDGQISGKNSPLRIYGDSAVSDVSLVISGGTFDYTGDGTTGWVVENVLKGTATVVDDAEIVISGGTFEGNVTEYLADGYSLAVTPEGTYKVGTMPNAEVKNLGSITVKNNEGDYKFDGSYYVYDLIGGTGLSVATEAFDMQIAMEFLAKDTAEEAAANVYGNYTTDFFITMTGMAGDSFVGNGCYLAGYYPSFGAWVKIPLDNFTVENGKVYPVITSAGFDFKYTAICDSVQDFICGIHLSDEVIEANPDMQVKLELGLSKDKETALAAEYVTVDEPYVYDVEDFETEEKVVAVTGRNVRLQDLIKIGFYFKVKEGVEAAEVGGLLWTAEDYLAEDSHTIESATAKNYSGLTPDASGTYIVETDGVFAQYLDQLYYFVPYIKTAEGKYKYGDAHEYSVLTYAENAMKWDPSKYGAAQKLVIDMLNYGTYAREYFGYTEKIPAPEEPFNSILTEEQKVINWSEDLNKSYSGKFTTNGTFEPKLYGFNANIQEAISLNAFYTNTEIDGAYYWTSESDIGNVEKASKIPARINAQIYKQALISGIYAYDIYDEYYVCAYDDEAGMDKNAYGVSVAGYLTNTITNNEAKTDNTSVALVNLCKSMQIYGKNADAFFAAEDK